MGSRFFCYKLGSFKSFAGQVQKLCGSLGGGVYGITVWLVSDCLSFNDFLSI